MQLRGKNTFSAQQLEDDMLLQNVDSILQATGVDPCILKVEATEAIALSADASLVNIFREPRKMGLRVAIDDFGIGQTSQRYLEEFPVDYVKIDSSLHLLFCKRSDTTPLTIFD